MKTINLHTGSGIQSFIFPDGQPHVNITGVREGEEVKVICPVSSSELLLQLLECSNALENLFAKKKVLVIPYLLGARSDRAMQHGDSIDLKVIADLINSMGFEKVLLFDVHSEAASLLIHNAVTISNRILVEQYTRHNAVLICPDAGAAKKTHDYFDWNTNITSIVHCNKSRDMSNGKISLQVLEPKKCKDQNCVIIDDICDGGGTFLAIASQIQPAHLSLVVTHGIFSKGMTELEKHFDEVIVSDSYPYKAESSILKKISIDYENL